MFPHRLLSVPRRVVAFALLLAFGASAQVNAQSTAAASIAGSVSDVATGLAIPNANVTLYRASIVLSKTVTDQSGTFHFTNLTPAVYNIGVRQNGYGSALSEDIAVVPGSTHISFGVSLTRQSGSQQQELRTIGRVAANSGRGGALQRTSTVSEDISSDLLSRQGYLNVGEGITTLNGVNNLGHSSTVGDDTGISLRGFDPSESQTLLDGHPIGPIGVGAGGYNFQISPFFVLRNTQVTFGAGALGLYGTDATGGAIDLQTISPTRNREIALSQGVGTQGKALSAFTATGTVGKLGYAIGGGTQGLYGNFKPQTITQTGNLGFDISPGNIAANTHTVSANYSLRDALVKLQYDLLPGTVASVTAYTARSRDDKSGVGDNDFQPYGPELAIAQGIASAPNGGPNMNACGVGTVAVVTDNAGTIACQTPENAAAGSFGPSGGGANPFQEIVNQDYHGRLTTNFLGNSIAIDGYVDSFNLNYNRNQASQNANGIFTGGFNQTLYKTNGFLVTDDLVHGNNDFGFGYFTQHQTLDTNNFDTGNLVIVPNPQVFLATDSVFLRDTFTPAPWLTLYTNVYYKLLSTTGTDTVDPRATILLRPTPRDAIRLIAGKTDGEPSAGLVQTTLNNTPSNINPSGACSTLVGLPSNANTTPSQVGVGQLGSSGLQQETATDYEVTYGHQFTNGSSFQVGGYVSRAANLITNVSLPIPSNFTIPPGLLQQYYARIQQSCGSQYVGTLADLSLSQSVNSSTSGLFRGIELTGRQYVMRNLSLNYAYDLQHAQIFGYSDADLMNNANAINGGQINGVPLNRGSLGAEYDNHRGLDARIDGYYYGINNGYHRPPYGFANLSLNYTTRTGTELTLGINNLTQSAYQRYGFFNAGTAPAVNSFNANQQGIGQEEFGLPPRQVLFTLTQHVR